MDDLDDLLDEIEKSFDNPISLPLKTNSKMTSKRSTLDEDIDEILKNTEVATSETKQSCKVCFFKIICICLKVKLCFIETNKIIK